MTRVKICGITRVADALEAARCGADAVGLVFYEKSPRAVSVETARKLAAAIPPFISVVALFVDAKPDIVRDVVARVPLDLLQFHGDEPAEYCTQFNLPFIKAIRVRCGVDLLQCAGQYHAAKGLLLDAHVDGVPGGTGTSFDWALIPRELPLPVILSGGLDSGNVFSAVRQVKPYAVDVSSGVEALKGIKDAAKIARFMQEVKRADV
ncbi:MAG: phosphoribosylanthranilate isomerase [Gallionella sp.]